METQTQQEIIPPSNKKSKLLLLLIFIFIIGCGGYFAFLRTSNSAIPSIKMIEIGTLPIK